jgi:hypothetical protein
MRFTLRTALVVAALLALSAGTAFADPADRVDAANHARAMHSLAVLHQQLDAQAERIAAPHRSAPATTARVAATDQGFNWVDGAIGAGLTAALVLAAAAVTSARHRSSTTA